MGRRKACNIVWCGHHFEARDVYGTVLACFDGEREAIRWANNRGYSVLCGNYEDENGDIHWNPSKREHNDWDC